MPADAGDWPFDGPPQAAGDDPDDYAAPAGRPCDDSQYWNNRCAGGPNCVCCRPLTGQVWVRSDYLLWWTGNRLRRGDRQPAGYERADAGVLGMPGTTILYGDSTVNGGSRSASTLPPVVGWIVAIRSGFRATISTWAAPTTTTRAASPTARRFWPGPSSMRQTARATPNWSPIPTCWPDASRRSRPAISSRPAWTCEKNVYCCECCDCCGHAGFPWRSRSA